MENKLIRKQIEGNESFPFVERTMKYGGAAFRICPQWKRGKIVKLSVYPLQQDTDYYYEWEGTGRTSFYIQGYDNLEEPKIMNFSYCKEHKCMTMRLIPPPGAGAIWFQVFTSNIGIGFLKQPFKNK